MALCSVPGVTSYDKNSYMYSTFYGVLPARDNRSDDFSRLLIMFANTYSLIWIQTVWHCDGYCNPQEFFEKDNFEKSTDDNFF